MPKHSGYAHLNTNYDTVMEFDRAAQYRDPRVKWHRELREEYLYKRRDEELDHLLDEVCGLRRQG